MTRVPEWEQAAQVVFLTKEADETAEAILERAWKAEGFGCGGSAGRKQKWQLTITVKRDGRLYARLLWNKAPIAGLDYHAFPAADGTPAGYHWDLHPPLVALKARVLPCRQPETEADALDLVREYLSLTLIAEPGKRLL